MKTIGLYSLLKIVLVVFLLSCGQVLFKLAAGELPVNGKIGMATFANIKLICALVIYAVATLAWVMILRDVPLRIAYSFVAMTFMIVPIIGYFVLHEDIKLNTALGAAVIMLGVYISAYR